MRQINVDKRGLLRALGGITAAGAGSAAVLTFGGQPAVAASFSAANVTVRTNDGELNSLSIQPEIDISWDGMESGVSEIKTTWYVETRNDDGSTLNSGLAGGNGVMTISADGGKEGSVSKQAESAWGLLGSPLNAGNFASGTDGEKSSRVVYLTMDVELIDSSGNSIKTTTDAVDTSFEVTVTNTETSVTVDGGSANTGGS